MAQPSRNISLKEFFSLNWGIIILTSHDSPEYREAAIRSKADYFFSKGTISNNGIFTLVKSILLTKGFNADGS
jgi:DNA-binding NarL/FixJ family response regulator